MNQITRVGLVAKYNLDAAAGVLAELAGWLDARSVHTVFETETAALAGLPPGRPTSSRDELPSECELIVVLGGDGTLIGMANRVAQAGVDVPILGVNFGSLGFLTEITLGELYESLESVLAGNALIDERMMLRARTIRRAAWAEATKAERVPTSSMSSQLESGTSQNFRPEVSSGGIRKALFTSTSRRPCSRSTRSKSAATAASSRWSQATAMPRPPAASTASAALAMLPGSAASPSRSVRPVR